MDDATFNPVGIYQHRFTRTATCYTCTGCAITLPLSESAYRQIVVPTLGDPHNERNMLLIRERIRKSYAGTRLPR